MDPISPWKLDVDNKTGAPGCRCPGAVAELAQQGLAGLLALGGCLTGIGGAIALSTLAAPLGSDQQGVFGGLYVDGGLVGALEFEHHRIGLR